MLRLLAFQSHNWGYTPFMEPLPIGPLTLCYGGNGSGKTTYLTAIGLLLGVTRLPSGYTYDRYVREGEGWAFLKAIAANHPVRDGKRPFDQIVPDPEGHATCTLACMLVYKAGEWKRSYYIVPGEAFQPHPDMRVDPSYSFTAEKYRAVLEHVGIRPASLRLLELGITGLREIREPKRLFNFFVDLIGSETIRDTYSQARREWRIAQERLEHTQAQHDRQQQEIEAISKVIQAQRQRRKLEQDRIRYQRFIDHARLRDAKGRLAEAEKTAHSLAQEQEQVEQDLQAFMQEYVGLQREQTEYLDQYQIWKRQRNQAEEQAHGQSRELAVIQERARALLQEITDLKQPPLFALPTIWQRLAAQRERESRLLEKIQSSSQAQETLLNEVLMLERGHSTLPKQVSDFLAILRGQAIPFQLVADYVQVRDSRWLKAVEGILGGERFTVVVYDPDLRLQAKKLAELHHYPFWISQPRNLPAKLFAPSGSLWEVVEVTDEHVAGWVADRLGHIRRVETVEEGHLISSEKGVITVTPEAYRQEQRGGRSAYPNQVVCGQAARTERLREIQRELEQLRDTLEEVRPVLSNVHQEIYILQQQEQRAQKQQELLTKEQSYASLQTDLSKVQAAAAALQAEYDQLKQQEDTWATRGTQLARLEQDLEGRKNGCLERLKEITRQTHNLHIETIKSEITQTEHMIPELSPEMQEVFDREQWPPSEYQKRIEETEQQLAALLQPEEPYDERLYEQQLAKVRELHAELEQARSRVRDHHVIFERAMKDYNNHIDQIFGRGMAHEFRELCPLASASGEIIVIKSDEDVNDWGLEVRIGFDGKHRESLANAPLSRGQEVLTSLYLVLAALRTVHATPILVLDELMSLLDEHNAPKVLEGLKETQAQCFVATPQSRFGADEQADVLWGFSCKEAHQPLASAIAVLVRRQT